MNFVPPPFPDDVDWDTGPYSRDELVVARTSLLHGLQRENSGMWQSIKYKLGILPNGHRIRTMESQHIWLPPELPHLWSAPVVLHDPSNPASNINNDDDDDDNDGGDEVGRNKERSASTSRASSSSSSRSNSRGAGPANSDNKDDNNSTSAFFSRKRKRDSSHHSDDQSTCDLTRDTDDDNDDDSRQKRKKKSPVKKRRKVGGNDAPESSCSNVSVIEVSSEEEEKEYVRVHQCDVCGFVSEDHIEMHHHLSQLSHCSSSLCLAPRPACGEKPRPAYLLVASKIQKREHSFKEKVVFCHTCHLAFNCLAQCLQHTYGAHQDSRNRYCVRNVMIEDTAMLERNVTECPDCAHRVPDRELVAHTRKTQHMSLYMGTRGTGATMLFVCPFCKGPYTDYVSFKAHVFSGRHAEQVGDQVTAMQYRLGPSIPKTILPQDPGGLNISEKPSSSQSWPKKKKNAGRRAKSSKKRSKKLLKERLAAVKAETKRNLS